MPLARKTKQTSGGSDSRDRLIRPSRNREGTQHDTFSLFWSESGPGGPGGLLPRGLGQDAEETVVGEQPGDRLGESAEHPVALSCQHGDEHERDQKKDALHERD